MDVVIAAFFFLVGAILSIIGYTNKTPAVGGLGGLLITWTGLMLITGGIDSQALLSQTQTLSSNDTYNTGYNTTFNFSYIINVTTSMSKSNTQSYQYANATDNNTRTLSIILMFAGLAVMFDAWMKRRPEGEL